MVRKFLKSHIRGKIPLNATLRAVRRGNFFIEEIEQISIRQAHHDFNINFRTLDISLKLNVECCALHEEKRQ